MPTLSLHFTQPWPPRQAVRSSTVRTSLDQVGLEGLWYEQVDTHCPSPVIMPRPIITPLPVPVLVPVPIPTQAPRPTPVSRARLPWVTFGMRWPPAPTATKSFRCCTSRATPRLVCPISPRNMDPTHGCQGGVSRFCRLDVTLENGARPELTFFCPKPVQV